mgnify:CR=1 FL=1
MRSAESVAHSLPVTHTNQSLRCIELRTSKNFVGGLLSSLFVVVRSSSFVRRRRSPFAVRRSSLLLRTIAVCVAVEGYRACEDRVKITRRSRSEVGHSFLGWRANRCSIIRSHVCPLRYRRFVDTESPTCNCCCRPHHWEPLGALR